MTDRPPPKTVTLEVTVRSLWVLGCLVALDMLPRSWHPIRGVVALTMTVLVCLEVTDLLRCTVDRIRRR